MPFYSAIISARIQAGESIVEEIAATNRWWRRLTPAQQNDAIRAVTVVNGDGYEVYFVTGDHLIARLGVDEFYLTNVTTRGAETDWVEDTSEAWAAYTATRLQQRRVIKSMRSFVDWFSAHGGQPTEIKGGYHFQPWWAHNYESPSECCEWLTEMAGDLELDGESLRVECDSSYYWVYPESAQDRNDAEFYGSAEAVEQWIQQTLATALSVDENDEEA